MKKSDLQPISIWLDDRRPRPNEYTHWCETVEEAIPLLEKCNVVKISLDHDLGLDNKTGYDLAKYIETQAFYGRMGPFEWAVHSANPMGVEMITKVMQQAETYWNNNNESS